MATINSTSCCGLGEIESICDTNNPKDTILEVAKSHFDENDRFAFYVFSDIERQINGKKLSSFILENKLGKVHKSITKRNPNTQNNLVIYTWAVAPRNFLNWYKQHKT